MRLLVGEKDGKMRESGRFLAIGTARDKHRGDNIEFLKRESVDTFKKPHHF